MESRNYPHISSELEHFMLINNIITLVELVALPDEVLVEMPGFGWRLLKEILSLRKVQ